VSEFTLELMRKTHLMAGVSVLSGWNLVYPGRYVDVGAIDRFLRDRYRYY